MRNTILTKFIITYVVILVLSYCAVTTISYKHLYNEIIKSDADAMYKQAINISNTYASEFYSGILDLEAISRELKTIATYNDTVIMIINNQNEIIQNSIEPINYYKLVQIRDFNPTLTGNMRYTIGNFYNYFNEDYLTVIAPVTFNFKVRSYVVIHKSIHLIEADASAFCNSNYLTLAVCMLLSLIFVLLIYFEVHKPINEITHAVKEFGDGNLNYKLKEYGNNEIGRLAAALSYMSKQLFELDESQKKFIANVSHDFRSPLTSIKGYLEAILDGTIPHEMQDKYLNIVIFETERLSKLTNNLLSLNNMDPKKNRLNIEKFDITQVIKRTIETFEGTCKQKSISFNLTFSDKSIMVEADLGKINQVIYNLIDNAIKFSHNNSNIFISVSERGEKAFVSVKDTGIGIPKESLNKIWDRFYKTDLSRGKDKKGTGLGLSIVKEIIKLHNENIDVISTEGAGTEFIFSLTKYVES